MPTHSETRHMPYTADEMYALVADISAYPDFLPWCSGCRIRERTSVDGREVVEADLIISFKLFRERFGSRVTLEPDERWIDVEYIDGPFKYLKSRWSFAPAETGSDVSFNVDFEFKSRTLQAIIGVVFNEAMRRVVRAFEDRARALYGPRAA